MKHLLTLTCLTFPGLAFADDPLLDRNIDTQLVHPSSAPEAALTVDSPRAGEPGQLSVGLAWQLENDPLSYTLHGGGSGAVISQRHTLHFGASLAAGERTTVMLRGSGAQLSSGELDLVAPAQPMALGDLMLGIKGTLVEAGPLAVGPAVGLWFPVGSADSWVSERSLRYVPALLASVRSERVELLANLGMMARVEVDSGADFVASPELHTGTALRLSATPWLGGLVELGSRHGMGNFMQPGAENPVEVKAGLRLTSQRWGRVDLLGGTGLTQGYGTSPLRLMVSVVGWTRLKKPEPVLEPLVVAPPPVVEPEPEPEVVPVAVAEPQRAWVELGRLVLDAPIAFEPGSATMLPESEALLVVAATVIHDYPQIELLVVEGHAADLGSASADYELSLRRARVVFEALVAQAVRPARLSYRGMGSAGGEAPGAPDSVDLVITKVRPLQQGPAPVDDRDILLPWSGEPLAAVTPGDKLLGVDGHPILEVSPLPEEQRPDDIPTRDSFLDALDEDEVPYLEEPP